MSNTSLKSVRTRKGFTSTPQNQKAVKGQIKNSDGGYVFKISGLDQVKRFLILGTNDSFYRSGTSLAKENAKTLIKVIESSPEAHVAVVDLIVEVSTEGRAPKQDPGLFALAIASSHGETEGRKYALSKLNEVARTGSSLFTFLGYVSQFRGWGRSLKNAVANWYLNKNANKVAFQAVKYRNRAGYSHRDVFRMSHPVGFDQSVGNYILKGEVSADAPDVIKGFENAKGAANATAVAMYIKTYGLTWEMVPTEFLNEKIVWEALLDSDNLPLGALIRQLGRLTQIGVIKPLGKHTKMIADRITDQEELVKARIHPINLLVAMKTYAQGKGIKGSGTWNPVSVITDSLDKAFYLAFKAVNPSGKRFLLGIDVSGSMTWGQCAGVPLQPCEAVSALALVIANTEPQTHMIGFAGTIRELPIKKSDSLDDVMRKTANMSFGATNPAAAIQYATRNGIEVDTFVILSDNEANRGNQHAYQALEEYRRKFVSDAKLITLDTEPTRYSIADTKDPLSLSIAGFDTSTPQVVSEFSRGI